MNTQTLQDEPPPRHLSAQAKSFWSRLQKDYRIDDAAGHLLLRNALEAFDRLIEAQNILKRDGVICEDRWGQKKTHPAVGVERDARQQMLAALRALRLEPGEVT